VTEGETAEYHERMMDFAAHRDDKMDFGFQEKFRLPSGGRKNVVKGNAYLQQCYCADMMANLANEETHMRELLEMFAPEEKPEFDFYERANNEPHPHQHDRPADRDWRWAMYVGPKTWKFLCSHARFHDADFLTGVELNPGPTMDQQWHVLHLANARISCPCTFCSAQILALLEKLYEFRHQDNEIWMLNYGLYMRTMADKMRHRFEHEVCAVKGCMSRGLHSPYREASPVDLRTLEPAHYEIKNGSSNSRTSNYGDSNEAGATSSVSRMRNA